MKVENKTNRPFFVSVKSLLDQGPAEVHRIDPRISGETEVAEDFSISTGVGHMKISSTSDFRSLEWEGYVPITNLEIQGEKKIQVHDGDTFVPSFISPKSGNVKEFFGSTSRSSRKGSQKKWFILLILVVLLLIFLSLRS